MRIGYITQWFPPEPGPVPVSIARGLRDLGHHVDVLTGFPNYPTGVLLDGYRIRPYQREEPEPGITVHRAPLVPSHSSSAIPRMTNYLSFGLAASAVARLRVPTPDVWLVYSSPATAAIPALRAVRSHRRPIFLLIQDLWPDSVTGSGFLPGGVGSAVDAALTRFCEGTYRAASGIGVISPGMRDVLVERGVPDAKIHDTPNAIEDSHLRPHEIDKTGLRAALGLPAGRMWMYAGNLGELQGLDVLVDAFAARPDAHLVLIGDGVARGRLEQATASVPNVHVIPSVPLDEIGAFIAASDVQVVSLQDTPLMRVTMPSKVQSALAASRPVLVHAAGDAATLVSGSGAGWTARPGDAAAIGAAIDAGLRATEAELVQLGRRARRVYESRFSPAVGAQRLSEALTAARDGAR